MKKIAIVTGASSGFGRDYANEIDKNFNLDEIWLVARREERLEEVAQNLTNSKGVVVKADLRRSDEIEKIFDLIDEDTTIDLLVNNAGFGKVGSFDKIDLESQLDMIDLNVKAVVNLTHRAIKYMKKGSKIINISSAASFAPLPYFNIYGATKVFVLNFSNALKVELEKREIDVIAVCPGPADTEFFEIQGGVKTEGMKVSKSIDVVKKSLRDLKFKKFISVYGTDVNILRVLSAMLPRDILTKLAALFKTKK
ncbi:MAG: short-chain dehydrogenase [Candidatus Delongbacteria bacterium]|nr:MAG: short-chain dehydrogenase [Candidatus Delongbacteria bacterium]